MRGFRSVAEVAMLLKEPSSEVLRVQEAYLHFLRQAVTRLGQSVPDDVGVHDTRKDLKRARAALRLLRPVVSDDLFDAQQRALKETAQRLGTARDLNVLCEAFDGEKIRPSSRMQAVRAGLEQQRRAAHEELTAASIGALRERLAAALAEMATQPALVLSSALLTERLAATYRRARKAMRIARHERHPAALHEWRKQAKCLQHQLGILDLKPRLAHRLAKLSDKLGDDRDRWLLAQAIGSELPQREQKKLKKERRKSSKQAFDIGARALHRRPRVFARRTRARLRLRADLHLPAPVT